MGAYSDGSLLGFIRIRVLAQGPGNQATMAMSTFVMTLAAIGAAYVMLRGDVMKSSAVLRRNLKQVKHWLEEDLPHESSQASRSIEVKARHIEERPMSSSMPMDQQPNSQPPPPPPPPPQESDQSKRQQM